MTTTPDQPRIAYRVSRIVAQAAWHNGDGIVVSARPDRGPLLKVWPDTTVNAASDTYAWSDLVAAVDGWDHPQSFYVLPRGV